MPTKLSRLLKNFRSNPNIGSRQRALALQEIWEAYPLDRRTTLRQEHGHGQYFPELPDISASTARLHFTLLKAETDQLDVQPSWAALDNGVSTDRVRRVFRSAKRQRPELFVEHQKQLYLELDVNPPPAKSEVPKSEMPKSEMPKSEVTEAVRPAQPKEPSTPLPKQRPSTRLALRDKCVVVIGRDTVNLSEMARRLEARGWKPKSEDVNAYLSVIMTQNRQVFERVKRGLYRLCNPPPAADVKPPPATNIRPLKKAPTTIAAAATPPAAAPTPPPRVEPNVAAVPIPRVAIVYEGGDAAWILERSAALGKQPREYLLSFIQADMQQVLAQLRVASKANGHAALPRASNI